MTNLRQTTKTSSASVESPVMSSGTSAQGEATTAAAVSSEESTPLVTPDSEVEPTISVVMPTLNEEEGVGECIESVKAALNDLGVAGEVILSDSSTDRTPEIGEELGARVVTPDEDGYGYAYRYAFEHVRGEYIVMGDADTTYDFSQIPRLLEPIQLGDADLVMGSRLNGDIEKGAMPALHRYVGNPLLTAFLNAFYDVGISDAHSGFRVFHRDVIETLDLSTNGMEFASEMVMEAGARDLNIAERPITYYERTGEATLESFRDGWRHVRFMLINAPGYLFSLPGTVIGLFGLVVMGLAWSNLTIGSMSLGIHSMLAGSLFAILGTNIVSLGVFATVTGNPVQDANGPLTDFVLNWATLERGATIGLLVFSLGAGWALSLIREWVTSGFMSIGFTMGSILAFTAIVAGVQIVFSSFFLSAVE